MRANSSFFEKRIGGSFHYQNYWMDRYADEIREKIFFKAVRVKNKKILDFGCGDGNWLIKMAIRGADSVYGVEQSKKLAESCFGKCFYPDIKSVPEKLGDFDLITAFTSMQFVHPDKRQKTIKDAYRRLKMGGKLCMLDYLPDKVPEYQKNKQYKKIWVCNEWVGLLLGSGFSFVTILKVNWVDTTIFHYFGGNKTTYRITKFLELFTRFFKPKYRLLIATKSDF